MATTPERAASKRPPSYPRAKRVFDVVVGGLMLVASLPLLAAIRAAMVATGDRGPFLYRAERLGELFASLAVAGPAVATTTADEASIGYVERTDEGLQILVNVPPDATVDVEDVSVTVDGAATEATAAPADSTTSVKRTAVLVMDTSNSMAGERFEAAQTAAYTSSPAPPNSASTASSTRTTVGSTPKWRPSPPATPAR